MRILYISQHYAPEMGAPAARVAELSRHWTRLGHEVTVLTANSRAGLNRSRSLASWKLFQIERDGKVTVIRVPGSLPRQAGLFRRLVGYVGFMVSAMVVASWRRQRFDLVIATCPQLLTGVIGWWISRLRRAPFVLEVRDLWPESLIAVGVLREGWLLGRLRNLAGWLYRAAEHIVTVGESYRHGLLSRYPIPAAKITIIPNGVEVAQFRFDESQRSRLRAAHGWSDHFVVLYLGTLGLAQGLEFVLQAAREMQMARAAAAGEIRFVLVGDGAARTRLLRQARRCGISHVQFMPPQPKDHVVGLYAAADAVLVPLRQAELFQEVIPSKLFEIMAMARPVILSVGGSARQLVEAAGCGICIEPENAAQLRAAIEQLESNPGLRETLGRRGRVFVDRYDRAQQARDYLALLEALVKQPATAGPAARQNPAAAAS